MSQFSFTKMHGLGNDFMVVDNTAGQITLSPQRLRELSDRHTGVGFDQLLMVESPTVADAEFNYRIFNADGSEVEHCGNGARCFARFVTDKGLTASHSIRVKTQLGVITLQLQDNNEVTVQMGIPTFEPQSIPLNVSEKAQYYSLESGNDQVRFGAVAIGNPHAVIIVDDIKTAEVTRIGPLVQAHHFFPNGVNVGFMQKIDQQNILLRVFERGVGETQACGTGACAAVAVGHLQGLLDNRVKVTLPGGVLKIVWPELQAAIEMTGPCSTVFEGHTRM